MSSTNSDWAILKSQAERIFADPIFLFVKQPQIRIIRQDEIYVMFLAQEEIFFQLRQQTGNYSSPRA